MSIEDRLTSLERSARRWRFGCALLGRPAVILTLAVLLSGTPVAAQSDTPSATHTSLPDLVAAVRPSVLTLESKDGEGKALGSGSGFVVTWGRLATNAHVIEGAHSVVARAVDGREWTLNRLQTLDTDRDLAILQLPSDCTLRPLLTDTALPREGERVVVVGSPRGLSASVSDGIVSAIRRENGPVLIQISAPISPGSSGSPVFDAAGRVIGVATMYIRDGQNLNFAVAAAELAALSTDGPSRRLHAVWRERAAALLAEANSLIEVAHLPDPNDKHGLTLWRQVESLLGRAVKMDPDNPEIWRQLSLAQCGVDLVVFDFELSRSLARSLATLDHGLARHPGDWRMWLMLASHRSMADPSVPHSAATLAEVREIARNVDIFAPETAEGDIARATAYCYAKRYDRAVQILRTRLAGQNQPDPRLIAELATTLNWKGDRSASVAEFERLRTLRRAATDPEQIRVLDATLAELEQRLFRR